MHASMKIFQDSLSNNKVRTTQRQACWVILEAHPSCSCLFAAATTWLFLKMSVKVSKVIPIFKLFG